MRFRDFYNSREDKSDKGTKHDYINSYYCQEFTPRRSERVSLVEIGIYNGHSLTLFRDWFTQGHITGIDDTSGMNEEQREKIRQIADVRIIKADAYQQTTADKILDGTRNYIIDDGSHKLYDQMEAVRLYYPKLVSGGKLIIEDVQHIKEASEAFSELGLPFEVFDFRANKSRYDDVLVVFTK